MDPLQEEITAIEEALLDLMIKRLDAEKMSPEEAQQLAKDFLALLPIHDKKELLAKLQQLSQEHSETQELYVLELSKVKDAEREQVLTSMRNAIHKGDIESAIQTAKVYTGA